MAFLNQWGIAFILWVQSLNPSFDPLFQTVNFLQTEEFFLIALPIVWWCINKRVGASLAILFLSSDYLVRLLKGITAVTRPYDADTHIRVLDPQADLSFPSAGAMDTLTFWGYLATQFVRRAFWVLAITLVLLLGFTRVYLGAHYPSDVVASILIGAVILVVFLRGRIVERILCNSSAVLWVLAIAWPIVLAVIRLNNETATVLGAMLGFSIGLLLEARYVRFDPHTDLWKQGAKLILGLAIGMALRLAIKPILPAGDIFTMARYAVIGLWMGAGAPWLFCLTHLAKRTEVTGPQIQPEQALS